EAQKILRWRVHVAAHTLNSAAGFTSGIERDRESGLGKERAWLIVVFDLQTGIAMHPEAARIAEGVFSDVLIGHEGQPALGPPEKLQTTSWHLVEPAVGLPAIHQPELDLEPIGGEYLNAAAIEEPRRVRRHVGHLVNPVFVVVVAAEADVREEKAGVYVD